MLLCHHHLKIVRYWDMTRDLGILLTDPGPKQDSCNPDKSWQDWLIPWIHLHQVVLPHQTVLMKEVVEREDRHPHHTHLPFPSTSKYMICCKNIDNTSSLVSTSKEKRHGRSAERDSKEQNIRETVRGQAYSTSLALAPYC